MKSSKIKLQALDLAVTLHGPDPITTPEAAGVVLATANVFAKWLGNPVVSLSIRPDPWTYNQEGGQYHLTKFTGGVMQLADNQQVSMTVEATDAKGFAATEAGDVVVTWDTSDSTVVSLQPAADGLSCLAVAGNPGAALVTVSDGTNSGSLAVDVTSGPAASLVVNAGTPEDQPAAP
jgi:hypothetical protein